MAAVRVPLPEADGQAPSTALAAMRRRMADAMHGGMWATQPVAQEKSIGGIRVLHHSPATPPRGTLVHFHGGAYRQGRPEVIGPYARRLANLCGLDVYCPAYRLAPEHPFPAGLNDGWAVVSALLAERRTPLVVAGDSAGGGLAASLTAMLVAEGLSPAGLVLHSPWLDLTVSSSSYCLNAANDPLFSYAAAKEAAGLYLQGRASDDPLASPLFAPLTGFPPTLITVGSGEVLRDDAQRMDRQLAAAGNYTDYLEVEGMDHVAVIRGGDLPGSAAAFAATVKLLGMVAPK